MANAVVRCATAARASLALAARCSLALAAVAVGGASGAGGFAQQAPAVVRADDPPVWGEALRRVQEFRIGVLDGEDEYTLGRVAGVAVAPDGTVWIADALAHAIRRYDATGRYLSTVGRAGEGPGEFRDVSGLGRLPDGRFVAWDQRLRRISFFLPDGTPAGAAAVPTTTMIGAPGSGFLVDDAGLLWIRAARFGAAPGQMELFWMRVDTTGAVVGTIPIPPHDVRGPRLGGRFYPFAPMYPYSTVTVSAPSPAGHLVSARNDRYAIPTRAADGRPIRIERAWTPVPVQPAERRERQTLGAHFRARNPLPETSASVPARKPPFWALWVDEESRLWVARHTPGRRMPETEAERASRERAGNPPAEWWDPLSFDVIAADGRFLGRVDFDNPRTQPMVARGRRIWVVEHGEFGEHYVVLYRIESG